MRAFIAIDLPVEIKTKFHEKEILFKKYDLAAKWVDARNTHLTLKFLGETGEDKLSAIKKIMASVARQFSPFIVNLTNFGFFPDEKNPRVFFVAIDNHELLKSIVQKLEKELTEMGFPVENKFHPHITLARVKNLKNILCLKETVKKITLSENFEIKKITLFESALTKTGPVYKAIFNASLTK